MSDGNNLVRVFTPDDDDETPPEPLTPKRALDMAIFAINTWLFPDASTQEDMNTLDKEGEAAILTLVEIRSRYETESAQG